MTKFLAILVGLLVVSGVIYILAKPRWAAMLVLLMFPIEQLLQSYLPALIEHHKIFNFGLASVVALAVVVRFFRGDRPAIGLINRVSVGALLLYAIAWVSVIWSPSGPVAVYFLSANVAYYVLLVIFTPLLFSDLADFGRIAIGIMVVGCLIAVLILINPNATYYAGRLTVDIGLWTGQRGGRTNPLALADMGGLMAVVAALIKFERRIPGLTILRLAAFVLGLGLAIATGSRGQVVAAGLAGVFFLPLARKMADPKQFIVMAIALCAVGLLSYVSFMLFIGEENRERWDFFEAVTNTEGRVDMVRMLLEEYIASPMYWLQGLGANAFTSLGLGDVPYVHNLFVEVLCELGLIGAAIMTMIVVATVRNGRWLWRMSADDTTRRSLAALLCALCFFDTMLMLKQGSFVAGGAYALTNWLIMAKIVAVERRKHEIASATAAPDHVPHDLEAETAWESEDQEVLAEAYERGEWSEALYGEADDEYATA